MAHPPEYRFPPGLHVSKIGASLRDSLLTTRQFDWSRDVCERENGRTSRAAGGRHYREIGARLIFPIGCSLLILLTGSPSP